MKALAPETIGMFEISYDAENTTDLAARFRSAQEMLTPR